MNRQGSVYPELEMIDAPMYYAILYEAVKKAINAIEHQNYGIALESLREAQTASRNVYLSRKERG